MNTMYINMETEGGNCEKHQFSQIIRNGIIEKYRNRNKINTDCAIQNFHIGLTFALQVPATTQIQKPAQLCNLKSKPLIG